uniref:Uncharacterized protein n=1 Tax=Oryza sativa subsp. japonica TaxID=39947 RepID=Q2QN07_ORYSJ|nr:hypothetical protein LOC_Os12g39389 [Oryza sativa Japonica Group]
MALTLWARLAQQRNNPSAQKITKIDPAALY